MIDACLAIMAMPYRLKKATANVSLFYFFAFMDCLEINSGLNWAITDSKVRKNSFVLKMLGNKFSLCGLAVIVGLFKYKITG